MIASPVEEIYKSALKFLLPLTPQDTYATVVREAMRLTGAKYGSIFLPKDGVMHRIYTSAPILYNVPIRPAGMVYTVYKTGKPGMRLTGESEKIHKEFKRITIGSDITIPLTYENVTVGVLSVLSYPNHQFTKDDLHLLELFAPLATISIRKSHLYQDLRAAIEFRDLFISIAAHELRTPLTSIMIYTQVLADALMKGKSIQVSSIQKLVTQETRLKILIDEFLQADTIKQRNLQFTMMSCDIKDVIKRTIEYFSQEHRDHPVYFHQYRKIATALVWGDADKLEEVLLNVLQNAAKFSPKGKRIDLSLTKHRREYSISIKDHGIGISREDLPHVFDQFYKGKKTNKGGMGLGLYLVKYIIEKHQGRIEVQSKIRQGTRVTISLPRKS